MMRCGKSCFGFSHTAFPSAISFRGNESDLTPFGRGVMTNELSVRSIVVNSKSTTRLLRTYRVMPISRLSAASLYCSSIVAPFDAAPVQQPVMNEMADNGGVGPTGGSRNARTGIATSTEVNTDRRMRRISRMSVGRRGRHARDAQTTGALGECRGGTLENSRRCAARIGEMRHQPAARLATSA